MINQLKSNSVIPNQTNKDNLTNEMANASNIYLITPINIPTDCNTEGNSIINQEHKLKNSNQFALTPQTNDKTIQKQCSTKMKTFKEDRKEMDFKESEKPRLTSIESRNLIYEYSKSKQYQEDNKENISQTQSQGYSEYEKLLLLQQANLLVSINKANDEKYKVIQTTKMKRQSAPLYNSAKKESDYKPSYRKSFDTAIEYSTITKKKKIYSTKKKFSLIIPLYSNEDKEFNFPLFIDKDIGIYEYWQAHIVEAVS